MANFITSSSEASDSSLSDTRMSYQVGVLELHEE